MSNTVPTHVKPSGPPVVPFAGLLPGIPMQPTATELRIVPAKVGWPGSVQRVYIECPDWCVVDHLDRVGHLDDLMHYSSGDVVQVLTLTDDESGQSDLYATIAADPSASDVRLRAAHIVINGGASATDAYLTPDMAEELADELIAFAAQIRHKARTVRLYNAAGGQA